MEISKLTHPGESTIKFIKFLTLLLLLTLDLEAIPLMKFGFFRLGDFLVKSVWRKSKSLITNLGINVIELHAQGVNAKC